MKISLITFFISLLGTLSQAAEGLHLKCSDGKTIAYAYLVARSAHAKSITNECNMGVGDEPKDCREVINLYEDKRATVSYQAGSQNFKKTFRVRRWSLDDPGYNPNRPLFSGRTQVQISSELTDQIHLGENPTNLFEYSVTLIRIFGHGSKSKNLGRVSLPCHTYRR